MLKRYLLLVVPSQAVLETEAKGEISTTDPVFILLLRSHNGILAFIFFNIELDITYLYY